MHIETGQQAGHLIHGQAEEQLHFQPFHSQRYQDHQSLKINNNYC